MWLHALADLLLTLAAPVRWLFALLDFISAVWSMDAEDVR